MKAHALAFELHVVSRETRPAVPPPSRPRGECLAAEKKRPGPWNSQLRHILGRNTANDTMVEDYVQSHLAGNPVFKRGKDGHAQTLSCFDKTKPVCAIAFRGACCHCSSACNPSLRHGLAAREGGRQIVPEGGSNVLHHKRSSVVACRQLSVSRHRRNAGL